MLRLGPKSAFFLIKFLNFTMRIEVLHEERIKEILDRGENVIAAFWHGRLLMTPVAYLMYQRSRLKILISRHRDGELISRAVHHFGMETVRGSSTRGGIAGIKGLARALQEGYDVAIAPDGPRGPRFRVQPGIIQLARISGRFIVPFTFSASPRKVFNSWDRFIIPYPFSRGVFVWGEPMRVDYRADDKEIEAKAVLLEKTLQEITDFADRYCEGSSTKDRR